MSLKAQAKVLRILQEKKFERVGGAKVIATDVRVIAATNKNLEKEMEEGRFRQDLYYRLNVIPLQIPPLRERNEDIPLLVDRFLTEFATKEGDVKKTIADGALVILMDHNWPGNVRELKNIVERLVIMASSNVISTSDIPPLSRENHGIQQQGSWYVLDSFKAAKMDFEKRYIAKKLQENEGNISKTAESIGLERSNLHKKIKIYNLDTKSE
jgi:two-component system nitrogen regulation response regulator NtrX